MVGLATLSREHNRLTAEPSTLSFLSHIPPLYPSIHPIPLHTASNLPSVVSWHLLMVGGRMLPLACREREHLRLRVLILLISHRNIPSLPISSAWSPILQGKELTSLVRS
jgi:hypothetical protein